MKHFALTLVFSLFTFATVNAQYYGFESSPCASGNCSLSSQPAAPSYYDGFNNFASPAVNIDYSSPCASGNCSLASYSAQPAFSSATYPQAQDYVATPAYASSPCASGNCPLSSSPSYGPSDYGLQAVSPTSYSASPCASGNCSLGSAQAYAVAPATVSPCASGNCNLAYSQPVAESYAANASATAIDSNVELVPVSTKPKLNVRNLLARAKSAADQNSSSKIGKKKLEWFVQPESELLDSQPGVDPYDVGCGNESEGDVIVVEVAAPSYEDHSFAAPIAEFRAAEFPVIASGGCATGNCPLMASY